MNTKIGSIWSKWDLHVHTHHSHLANQYNCPAKEIAKKIKEEEIKVVGVTNYFIVLEEEVKELNEELNGAVTLLPNFEFRINDKNQKGEYINVHVIFNLKSDNVTFQKIYNSLSRVPIHNISTENKKYCTIEDIKEFGFDNVTVNFDALKEQLSKDFVIEDDFLIIGVNSGYGGFHPDNKPRNIHTAIKMDKTSHIIFGTEKDTAFFLSSQERLSYGLPQKCVIKCSDAHTVNDIGQNFTWIKSSPTFNGLKQTIYEPKERVKIQASNPQCDFAKPYFSTIHIKERLPIFPGETLSFGKQTIPLNPNLICIIGGRGEGKSILIDFFANGFGLAKPYDKYNSSEEFIVTYKKLICQDDIIEFKFDKENYLDFLYISQNAVKERVLNVKELGDEIKKMLGLDSISFSTEVQDDIEAIIIRHRNILEWFAEENKNGIEIHNRAKLLSLKKRAEELLSSITSDQSREQLTNYTENVKSIRVAGIKIEKIEALLKKIESFKSEIDEELIEIRETLTAVSFEVQKTELVSLKTELELTITKNKEDNESIKESFAEIFKGDLSSLLANADKYKSQIETINDLLLKVDKKEKELEENQKEIKSITEIIDNELKEQTTNITNAWNTLIDDRGDWSQDQKDLMRKILEDRNIEIKGKIYFNKEKFYTLLKDTINGTYWKNKNKDGELETFFKIDDYASYKDFLENRLEEEIKKNELLFNLPAFQDLFYDLNERNKYLFVQPEITYGGKILEKTSVGQRGTVYLALQLATNTFSTPIIFDQPEDDLDNRFIIDELIEIFKEIKKFRQVIIVTHNANLVINADAEQIIIASNKDEILEDFPGPIENEKIIEEACEILEGGYLAFDKRKNKYNYKL